MPQIQLTEVSIVPHQFYGEEAHITKLAGSVGQQTIKLFAPNNHTGAGSYVGLTLQVSPKHNSMWIESNFEQCTLKKTEKVTLHFDDNSLMELNFLTGKFRSQGANKNIIFITDQQLLHLMNHLLDRISFEPSSLTVEFTSSNLYTNKFEGQQLFQIMATRIVGGKQLLIKKIN